MASQGDRDEQHSVFWEVAEPFLGTGRLVEGTMMGHQCLRTATSGGFVATVERETGNLVVKLPKTRVAELISEGVGTSFAPAGKVFSEWVAVADPGRESDSDLWEQLIEESMEFVSA